MLKFIHARHTNPLVMVLVSLLLATLFVLSPIRALSGDAEAFVRLCNSSSSPRSLPIGSGSGIRAYVSVGTCTGLPSANYDAFYIPSGYYAVRNSTVWKRTDWNGGWIYLGASASGTVRLYRL